MSLLQVSPRTDSDKFKNNATTITTTINATTTTPNTTSSSSSSISSDNGARKDTPPQPRSSHPLLSLFRPVLAWPALSFPSWSPSVDGTTNAPTSFSLWSRVRSQSLHSSLSTREQENLRSLREEAKRGKTTRMQSSVSSGSLQSSSSSSSVSLAPSLATARSSSSSLNLATMMNTGAGWVGGGGTVHETLSRSR